MNTNKGTLVLDTDEQGETTAHNLTPQPVDMRVKMIKMGLEAEMIGMRLTSRAPPCFSIIAKEYGIKVKRGSGAEGKRAAYEAFCVKVGLTPKAPKSATVPTTVNG